MTAIDVAELESTEEPTPDEADETPEPAAAEPLKRLRVVVARDTLDAALKDLLHAASTKASLPILSHVLITVDEHGVNLRTTNLEIGIARRVVVESPLTEAEYGSVCIPARKLAQFVASLNKGDIVTITQTAENAIKIEAKRSRARAVMVGMGSTEFPTVPLSARSMVERNIATAQSNYALDLANYNRYPNAYREPTPVETDAAKALEAMRVVRFPVAQLQSAIKQVVYCAAEDDARPVFTGVCLHNRGGERLVFVAADSFRLGICTFEAEGLGEEKDWKDVLIPATSLIALGKLLGKRTSGMIELLIPSNRLQVMFTFGDTALLTNTLSGTFPDYNAIIPHTHTTTVEMVRADLEAALVRAMQFARDAGNVTVFRIREGEVTITAQDDDQGTTEQDLDATVSYRPFWTEREDHDPETLPETGAFLNGTYVRDFATVCPTARVRMTLRAGKNGPNTDGSVTFSPIPNGEEKLGYDLTYIAMPMHSTR